MRQQWYKKKKKCIKGILFPDKNIKITFNTYRMFTFNINIYWIIFNFKNPNHQV